MLRESFLENRAASCPVYPIWLSPFAGIRYSLTTRLPQQGSVIMGFPSTIPFPQFEAMDDQRVAITGIGMITSVGLDRESTWEAICQGRSGVVWLDDLPNFPPRHSVGAVVDWDGLGIDPSSGRLKSIAMAHLAADEAIADAKLDIPSYDPYRVACAIAGHMGDSRGIIGDLLGKKESTDKEFPWWKQMMPDTACVEVAQRIGAYGPRLSHSTACASGLISTLTAVRAIRDGVCDVAIAGGSESIDPLFVAGFHNMRALAHHDTPTEACRPFDRNRTGFVMGEGAAIFVLERLSHAIKRGARIYCTLMPGRMLSEAHHVTGLDMEQETLRRLIGLSLRQASLNPEDIGYINAHGTGTEQNDRAEMNGIASAFGDHLSDLCVSATKSMIGHLVNAAGAAELAVTVLSMRDGFIPPTRNLTDPDPACRFDCVPQIGRYRRVDHAMKLSLAFGGHLVGVVASRWNDEATGFGYPSIRRAA